MGVRLTLQEVGGSTSHSGVDVGLSVKFVSRFPLQLDDARGKRALDALMW